MQVKWCLCHVGLGFVPFLLFMSISFCVTFSLLCRSFPNIGPDSFYLKGEIRRNMETEKFNGWDHRIRILTLKSWDMKWITRRFFFCHIQALELEVCCHERAQLLATLLD